MRARSLLFRALVVSSALAGCNALSGVGDYTFGEVDDAGREASSNDSGSGSDATDAATDSPIDARTPDADATPPPPCTIPSPSTTERFMVCGSTSCNLDEAGVSPPLTCCVGPDGGGKCIAAGQEGCAPPSFNWVCTRARQCPFPSPCCLTIDKLTPTCPPTARALESRCSFNPDSDGGCGLDLELCTGGERCKKPGTTCLALDVVGPGARPLGVCL